MGEFMDKAKGAANDAMGKAKVSVGQHADKPELIVKGGAQQVKGKMQTLSGEVKGAMGDKI